MDRIVRLGDAFNLMVLIPGGAEPLAVTVSQDGGAFGSFSPVVTDRGNGWFNLAFDAGDNGTLGEFCYHIVPDSGPTTDGKLQVVSYALGGDMTLGTVVITDGLSITDGGMTVTNSSGHAVVFQSTNGPSDAFRLIAGDDGGHDMFLGSSCQIDNNNHGLPILATGVNVAAMLDNSINPNTFSVSTGLRPLDFGSCSVTTSTTVVLDSDVSAVNDFYNGCWLQIVADSTTPTSVGQMRRVSGYVGATRTATVDPAWLVTPTSGNVSQYALLGRATINANLTQCGGSTVPAGAVPNAVAGAAGGLLIAGANAATTVNLSGNITGNLSGSVGSVTGNVGGNVVGSVASVVGAVGSVTGLTAADVAAIKAKTDSLTFTVAGKLDANILYVNGLQITGSGTVSLPWGPA